MRRPAALPFTLLLAAWGPHPEITDAGISPLGKDHPLVARLGAEAARLRQYCWMGDWRRSLQDGFYADDYLLFPAATKHYDHLCPEVKATYEPYFRRALQALRTETPANAARWIGSILHFLEDTGSPPHAAEFRGDLHSKMENWIDAKEIRLEGYAPQLLGETDDAAVAGFLRRMDGLIAFSRERGLKLKPIIEAGDRKTAEPLVLECALETSRVVADLLHTLGKLGNAENRDGASLRGTISSRAPPGLEKIPAKVLIEGTLYSTLADGSGLYEFRNLPAGSHRLRILRAGCETAEEDVTLEKSGRHARDITLRESSPAGNLVRNADFRLRWVRPNAPDGWHPSKDTWEGEAIPVRAGGKIRLAPQWRKDARGEVFLRWRSTAYPSDGKTSDESPLKPGDESRELRVPEGMTHARIVFRGAAPETACDRIALTAEP